jgi:hypothetical protein
MPDPIPVDFPSSVFDITPTFLVGGKALLNLDPQNRAAPAEPRPALASTGASGLSVLASETISEVAEALALVVGRPVPYSADVTLSETDNLATLVLSGTPIVTVDEGLPAGFGCLIRGEFTLYLLGAVEVTDTRFVGTMASWCALVQTGPDTYDLIGHKV